MSEHDSFEERLRALADQVNRSVQRMSEVDLEDLAGRFGVDAEGARGFADAAGQWLNERLSGSDPFFSQRPPSPAPTIGGEPDAPAPGAPAADVRRGGPHPLDLPTEPQGRALSALDSGRWTVRPGSNALHGTGGGPPPPAAPDLVGELRARDWIMADGTLTFVGRRALARWCAPADAAPESSADRPEAPPAGSDSPPAAPTP